MDITAGQAPSTRLSAMSVPEDQRLARVAKDFEASYLGSVFSTMLEDALPNPPGGIGEEMFRSVLANAMARQVAEAGGVGIARSVAAQLREYRK